MTEHHTIEHEFKSPRVADIWWTTIFDPVFFKFAKIAFPMPISFNSHSRRKKMIRNAT